MKIPTITLVADGGSILLLVAPTEELLAEQARVVATVPGQRPIRELHVTLMQSAGPNTSLPPVPLPTCIELNGQAKLVTHNKKTSVYLRLASKSQLELAQVVAALENALHISEPFSSQRIFHVSLTNLVGAPKESVARIWEHRSTSV